MIARQDRALVAVKHTPENLEKLVATIDRLRFGTIGIELPSYHGRNGELNIFEELARIQRNRGARVVCLEDDDLYKKAGAVFLQLGILSLGETCILGDREVEKLKALANTPHMRELVEAIENNIKSADALYAELNALSEERSAAMLKAIRRDDVQVAVMGTMHVADIRDELPGYELIVVGRD